MKYITLRVLLACIAVSGLCQCTYSQKKFTIEPGEITLDKDAVLQVEQGTLAVPEDHADPKGNTIEINFVRLKSTSASPGKPIFYLAGGPGGSGISAIKTNQLNIFLQLRTYSDVIIFDQRGTGITKPVLTDAKPLALPLDRTLDDPASVKAYANYVSNLLQSAKEKGAHLENYNTLESAADIEDLRKALQADKIILWGHSYGSHLALAYIKSFGDRVEKAILEGVNGLHQRFRFPSEVNLIFNEIDKRIGAEPKLREKIPSFPRLVTDELNKLEKHPVTAAINADNKKVGVVIGRMDAEAFIIKNIGNISFIRELPMIFYQMSQGNYFRAAELTYALKTMPAGTPMTWFMHYASGVSAERLVKIEKDIPNGILRNAINYPYTFKEVKELIQAPDLGEKFRKQLPSDVPTLFVSADLDGRTSVADALEVKKNFSNSVFVLFKNTSHDFLSPQLASTFLYFLKGELRRDTTFTTPNFDLYPLNSFQVIARLYAAVLAGGKEKYREEITNIMQNDYLSNSTVLPVAYQLLRAKKADEALHILKINTEVFPAENWQVYHAFGDAYLLQGNKQLAKENYEKALALNPLSYSLIKLMQLNK